MKLLAAVCVLFALLAVASAQSTPTWSLCQGAPTHFTINGGSVTLDPNSRNVTAAFNGKIDEQVTSGNIEVDVYYSGAEIAVQNYALSTAVTLPVGPGAINFDYSTVIPSIAPSGDYSLTVTVTDQASTALTCVNINFSL